MSSHTVVEHWICVDSPLRIAVRVFEGGEGFAHAWCNDSQANASGMPVTPNTIYDYPGLKWHEHEDSPEYLIEEWGEIEVFPVKPYEWSRSEWKSQLQPF